MRPLPLLLIFLFSVTARAEPQGIEVVCESNRYLGVFEDHVVIDSSVEKKKKVGASTYFKNQRVSCTVGGYEVAIGFVPESHEAKEKCTSGLGAFINVDINSQSIITDALLGPSCQADAIESIEFFDVSDNASKGIAIKICGSGPRALPDYNACITVTDKQISKLSKPLSKPLVELLKTYVTN